MSESESKKIWKLRKKLRRLRQKQKRRAVAKEKAEREAEIWKKKRQK